MFTQDETEPMGVGGMSVTIWDWYSEELIGAGITHSDGSYDIGVDVSDSTLAWMDVGEAFEITDRYLGVFADGGYSGNGGTWKEVLLGPSGTQQNFDVIVLNTLVHGQVTDDMGHPVSEAYIDVSWDFSGYYDDQITSYIQADEQGHYQFWGLNGQEVNIYAYDSMDSFEEYNENVYIFSEVFDDYYGGYIFNYNIVLQRPESLPLTDLIENNGFEELMPWDDRYAEYWDYNTDWNHYVEFSGANIHGSGATFTAYDGENSLKITSDGMHGNINSTDVFQIVDGGVDEGAIINAGAMMMSHEDDWIGQTHGGEFSGRNNGQVYVCLLYTSPSPRDRTRSRMPSSA